MTRGLTLSPARLRLQFRAKWGLLTRYARNCCNEVLCLDGGMCIVEGESMVWQFTKVKGKLCKSSSRLPKELRVWTTPIRSLTGCNWYFLRPDPWSKRGSFTPLLNTYSWILTSIMWVHVKCPQSWWNSSILSNIYIFCSHDLTFLSWKS